MSSSGSAAAGSPFAPFAHRAFALLWTATLISNIGTWMHEVGAGWLMTELSPSPAVVTLVQAATSLPVFLFALFAGTLADRLDKRRMLIAINLGLFVVISTLAALVWAGAITPPLLILFTLAIGTGAAFMAPAWQAIVPVLVPRSDLQAAIGLNSMGINVSRAIGPAVAGLLIAAVGLAAPFALNAASHLVIIGALLLWRPETAATPRRSHLSITQDMATGLRHVRHNMPMRKTLIRSLAFFIFASAFWAMMPLIARDADDAGSSLYGFLVATVGTGAVIGALTLPYMKRSLNADRTVQIGTALTAAALVGFALSSATIVLLPSALLGGVAWILVLTSLNVSAQMALPDWVRARGLAVNLMVFFGSMSAGSLIWGQVASRASVDLALLIAAGGLILGMLGTLHLKIATSGEVDLSPANAWPEAPALATDQSEDATAIVMIQFQIAPADKAAFLDAAYALSAERYRDGATHWAIVQDINETSTWVEIFQLPSWAEHLRQHDRNTTADAELRRRLHAFDKRPDGPVIRHFIASS
ncbi:MAG TPA: MFS transporter [Gemmobacter sp.]|nr:MFS transporter [Gemmobacter sp.]